MSGGAFQRGASACQCYYKSSFVGLKMPKLGLFDYGLIWHNDTDNYIIGLIDEGLMNQDLVLLESAQKAGNGF